MGTVLGDETVKRIVRAIQQLDGWRSTVLDASAVEQEVFALIFAPEKLLSFFKYFKGCGWRFEEHLKQIVFPLCKISLQFCMCLHENATVGMKLMGLSFSNRHSAIVYLMRCLADSPEMLAMLEKVMRLPASIKSTIKAYDCISWAIFLYDGSYRLLCERLLKMRIAKHRIGAYSLNFAFTEREVLFRIIHVFFEPLFEYYLISVRNALACLENCGHSCAFLPTKFWRH